MGKYQHYRSIFTMKLGFFSLLLSTASCTYLPPAYKGTPVSVSVVSLDPPDYRGEESYRIEFSLQAEKDMPNEGFVHRTWADFQKFDHLLTTHLLNFGLSFPSEPSIENLDAYLSRVMTHSRIINSNPFNDFLGINWDGSELKFLQSLQDFLQIVIPPLYRAPDFPPEPPVFDTEMEVITSPETQFEIWTYLTACPDFSGEPDDSDVLPPGVNINMPLHFNSTFVHFLPKGYLNGHTVRISFLGKTKFNFLDENKIEDWVRQIHGDKKPTRILDIGTGPGFSAYTYARVFPEAEVIGIDLAAPYIRFARMWNEIRNVSNIQFYGANAEDLSWLESGTFDIINYAYVLHEMPSENALRVVNEMYRLLKPGGMMNGFEVPYPDTQLERDLITNSNTWGHDWHDSDGPQGPEPYAGEYMDGTKLTDTMVEIGFNNVEQIEYSYFDSLFIGTK